MKLTPIERGYLKVITPITIGLNKFGVPANWVHETKHNILLRYIESNYGQLIDRYKATTSPRMETISPTAPVYVMWYQGEEQMPPMVKASYASIKRHAGQHPVVLVTKDNIRQLLSECPVWDDEIYDYLERKSITLTQLADFFRLCMLYSKGGFWIDATVLINRDLDEMARGLSFVSGRVAGVKSKYFVVQGKWTTFFIGSAKGNLLLKFIYELLLAHLKDEGRFIEYLMIDYAFETAYRHLPYVREPVDAVPPMPSRFYELHKKRNKAFSSSDYEKMCREVPLFKMSNKEKLKPSTSDGRPTYYGHILARECH